MLDILDRMELQVGNVRYKGIEKSNETVDGGVVTRSIRAI